MNHVSELTPFHRLSVARLMARVQPELWNVQEALEMLNSCQGWFLEDAYNGPIGWLAAHPYPAHRSIEIESMGFNDGGISKIGHDLAPLIDACEDWAVKRGLVNCRFITSSQGMSCHNKEIFLPGEEIRQLQSEKRPDLDWLMMRGYQTCGILPEIFGTHSHGIILVKQIQPVDIGFLFRAMTAMAGE